MLVFSLDTWCNGHIMNRLSITSSVSRVSKWEKALLYDMPEQAERKAINQDYYLNQAEHDIYGVADGKSAGLQGLIAAKAVSLTFSRMMTPGGNLPQTAAEAINRMYDSNVLMRMQQEILHVAEEFDDGDVSAAFTGMIITPDNYANFLHVGDGRLLLRVPGVLDDPDDEYHDRILQQTTDQVTGEGNNLTNYLGVKNGHTHSGLGLTAGPDMRYGEMHRAEWGSVPLNPGSRLLLMTNGSYGGYGHERMPTDLLHELTSRQKMGREVSRLVAIGNGKLDDSTVLTIDAQLPARRQYRLAS